MRLAKNESKLYVQGRAAVTLLWTRWRERPDISDPREPEFARGVLDEIIDRLLNSADVDKEIREFSEAAAEQVTNASRTIFEILQNADDLGSDYLRLAVRRRGSGELIAVHGGSPIVAADVIAMTLAFLSLKRQDARSKGRFGIGLKTLNQLGSKLSIHCPPYHFEVEKGQLRKIGSVAAISGLYSPTGAETLLKVSLDGEYGVEEILGWAREIDTRHLLFLDHVRDLSIVDTRTGKPQSRQRLERKPLPEVEVEMRPGVRFLAKCVESRDESNFRRRWTRYSIDYPVPETHRRAHKATGEFTELSVAISVASEPGVLAAGLPFDLAEALPVSLNAQFDPDLARRGLQQRPWNKWLFERLCELVGGISLLSFEADPRSGWQTVPLQKENSASDPWTNLQITELIETVQERLRSGLRLRIGDQYVTLAGMSYVVSPLSKLLSEADQLLLAPNHVPLPRKYCDRKGRWFAVIEELHRSYRINVRDALALLELDDEVLGHRSDGWFVDFADAALEAGYQDRLAGLRSVLTVDGSRHAPKGDVLLVQAEGAESISSLLGLQKQIAPAFFSGKSPERVKKWLATYCLTPASDSAIHGLAALSRRKADDPLYLDDDALLTLRDALRKVDELHRIPLASAIGHVVYIDGYEYRKGVRRPCRVRPATAYLPTLIAKDTGGWAAAAKTTEGLFWIDARYGELLRLGRSGELSAKRILMLLGARAGPRLLPREGSTRIPSEVPVSQLLALRSLPNSATDLQGDYISPDLEKVVENIVRQRLDENRRGRSRALFETLVREWDQYLSDRAEAQADYYYYVWRNAGSVPATWLASLASEPWLSSKSKRKVAPRQIAIETATTRLTRGTRGTQFVYELTEADSASPVVRALEIKGTPPASEIVEEIVAIRNKYGDDAQLEDILPLYAALSALISGERAQTVGDLLAMDLRRQFETHKLLVTNAGWQAPSSSFRGRPIFGSLRGFVRESRQLAPLWQLLKLRTPGTVDCLDVLEQIAGTAKSPDAEETGIIVDSLRTLAEQDDLSSRAVAPRLAKLPLWTPKGWQDKRPIYAVLDPTLQEQLSKNLPIWLPGCSIDGLVDIPQRLGLNILTDDNFTIGTGVDVEPADELTSHVFAAAVDCLRDELARKSQELSTSINWAALEGAGLFRAPKLAAEATIGGQKFSVPRLVHVDGNRALYFVDQDDLSRPEIGERILASFAVGKASPMLGFVWSFAWREAEEHGAPIQKLVLASETVDLDPLDQIAKRGKKAIGKRLFAGAALDTRQGRGKQKIQLPKSRRLKDFEGATIADITIVAGAEAPKEVKPGKRPLKLNPASQRGAAKPNLTAVPIREWSEKERERLGFELLAGALKQMDDAKLDDFSALRGIGADSIDDLDRFFELKVFAGDAPDEVRFEASEFERAVKAKKDYFLAVVSGLEEGKETQIRIFADPVRTLPWHRKSQIKLGGIRSAGSRVLTISIKTPDASS